MLVVATLEPNLVRKQALFGSQTGCRQTPSQSLEGVSAGSATLWDVPEWTPQSELDFADAETVIEMRRSRQFNNILPCFLSQTLYVKQCNFRCF